MAQIDKTQGEFNFCFKISKMVIFEVKNYRCGSNEESYFATSAAQFVKNKKDFNMCGQCQDELLPKGSKAYKFWQKWDKNHCKHLTTEEVEEVKKDIEELKARYNFIESENETISFYREKELSKLEPRRQ